MTFVPITADQLRSPRDIAATLVAGVATARCGTCGHAAVELPRAIRVAGAVVTHGHHAGECGAHCASAAGPCALVTPAACAGTGCPMPAALASSWCASCDRPAR